MSADYTTCCSACGSMLCTRNESCPTCETCGKRGHTYCSAVAPVPAKPQRPKGWWRSRSRAQLQVEYACMRVRGVDYDYGTEARCLNCAKGTPRHESSCPLGEILCNEEIALAIEELERE